LAPDEDGRKLFELGGEMFNRGDHSGAEEAFRSAIRLDPTYIGVLHNSMVKSISDTEDWQRTITMLRFVMRVDYDYALARDNLAAAYLNYGNQEAQNGNFELAIDIYTTGLCIDASADILSQLKANTGAALTSLGIQAGNSGNLGESLRWMLRACNYHPSQVTRHNVGLAYTVYAISLLEEHKPAEAIYYFEEALQVGFFDPVVFNNYGVALASLGQLAEAERKFERALEVAPEDATIQGNIAKARRQIALFAEHADWQEKIKETPVDFELSVAPPEYLMPPARLESAEYVMAA
jgi:tetratricopeptide (TPR) repeat protein